LALSRGSDVVLRTGAGGTETIACAGDALRDEQTYFIGCVQTGQPVVRCSPASTRTSIALAWLEQRAIELGRTVRVPERLRAVWGS